MTLVDSSAVPTPEPRSTLTLEALQAHVASFGVVPPRLQWEFRQSRYIPPGEVIVCDPHVIDDPFAQAIREKRGRQPYLILAAQPLTSEQQLCAMLMYLEKTAAAQEKSDV